jgi:hypothetical protein
LRVIPRKQKKNTESNVFDGVPEKQRLMPQSVLQHIFSDKGSTGTRISARKKVLSQSNLVKQSLSHTKKTLSILHGYKDSQTNYSNEKAIFATATAHNTLQNSLSLQDLSGGDTVATRGRAQLA